MQSCFNNGGRSLWFWTWKKAAPDLKSRSPYKCRNWRCPGADRECAKHEQHVTYARMKEGIERDQLDGRGFVFAVLTLDREGHFSDGKKRWQNSDEAYAALSRMTRKFFERLRRWMKRAGMRPLGREWVATVEAHRSGWPHVNILLWSPELADYVEREQVFYADTWQKAGFSATQFPPVLLELARSSHWGTRATIERVRSQDAVLNYVAKLAGEAGQAMSEVAKLTQLPLNAPTRFRRLRSGKGWLPPRRKSVDGTGSIMMRKFDRNDGTPHAMPVATIKDPTLAAHMAEASYAELRLWDRERENAAALREALDEARAKGAAALIFEAQAKRAGVRLRRAFSARELEAEAMRAAYEQFGTPLNLKMHLPLPPEKNTGPPAPAPLVAANDFESAQLELGPRCGVDEWPD